MLRRRSRQRTFALVLGMFALFSPLATARAHGPAPAALGVLAWDGEQVELVRLNVGLARRVADGRFRFVCPALWGDERGAPAAPLARGEIVLAAGSGLFVLSGDGAPQPHPDANARGAVVDLVRAGDGLYALRVAGGQSELLAIDAQRVRAVWNDPSVFFSLAAERERLLALRASELNLEWQWLDVSGAPGDAGQLALPISVEYAFARLSRELPYALVLEQGRPELGSLASGSWVSIAKGAASIAGPLAVEDADLIAVDGQLSQLDGVALEPLAPGPYVTCLDHIGELAYACTREGLARVSASGVGDTLFALSQLAPPDLSAAADQAQREACDYQWQDLRFDLLALGVQVSLDPEPAVDAGAPQADAGARPDAAQQGADASAPQRARAPSGCSAQPPRAAPPPLVFIALMLALVRRFARIR